MSTSAGTPEGGPGHGDGGPQAGREDLDEANALRRRLMPGDPRRVGEEPDYRFTLANERTFLAWIRTALALSAGGLAAVSLLDEFAHSEVLGIGLLTIAFLTAAGAYRRWALAEQSMRLNRPLPSSRLPQAMAIATAAVAVIAAILFVIDQA